jgi:hypothetical protein
MRAIALSLRKDMHRINLRCFRTSTVAYSAASSGKRLELFFRLTLMFLEEISAVVTQKAQEIEKLSHVEPGECLDLHCCIPVVV